MTQADFGPNDPEHAVGDCTRRPPPVRPPGDSEDIAPDPQRDAADSSNRGDPLRRSSSVASHIKEQGERSGFEEAGRRSPSPVAMEGHSRLTDSGLCPAITAGAIRPFEAIDSADPNPPLPTSLAESIDMAPEPPPPGAGLTEGSTEPSVPALNLDRAFEGYRTVRRIAEHPGGVVFKAEDQELGKLVILKLVRGHRPGGSAEGLLRRSSELERFRNLRHPQVGALLDVRITDQGDYLFISEFVKGAPLLEYARTNHLNLRERLALFVKVCSAVNVLHQRCLVHRDLRPTNVLVTTQREVRIVGGGPAAITDSDLGFQADTIGEHEALHFYPYRSPEQVRSETIAIDARSDVYALGVLLYQLLLNRTPHELVPGRKEEISRIICEQPPLDPVGIDRSFPPALKALLLCVLSKDPDRRPEGALALAREVQAFLDRGPYGPTANRPRRPGLIRLARYGVPVALGAAIVLLAAQRPWLPRQSLAQGVPPPIAGKREAIQSERDALLDRLRDAERNAAQEREAILAARKADVQLQEEARGRIALLEKQLQEATDRQQTLASRLEAAESAVSAAARINEFLAGVLGFQPMPDGEPKRSASVDLIAAAADKAAGAFSADPLARATVLSLLASASRHMGGLAQAAGLLTDALEIRARNLGEEHETTITTLDELANVLYAAGNWDACERNCRRLLTISTRAFGPDDPRTLTAMNNLALALQARGRLEEAESLFRSALDGRRRVLGKRDAKTGKSAFDLGVLLVERGNMTEAREFFRECLKTFKKVAPADPTLIATAKGYLGGTLVASGRYDLAEPLLMEAHDRLSESLGADHPEVRAIRERIASMYALWNRPDDAAAWRAMPAKQAARPETNPAPHK